MQKRNFRRKYQPPLKVCRDLLRLCPDTKCHMAMLHGNPLWLSSKFIYIATIIVCMPVLSNNAADSIGAHCLHQQNKIRTSIAMANDLQSYLSNCGTLNNSIFPQSSGWRWIHCYRGIEKKQNRNNFETGPKAEMPSMLVVLVGSLVQI